MDLQKIRNDFSALFHNDYIYLDNTSSTLTPQPVIEAIVDAFNSLGNSRSGHVFSVELMEKCNESRLSVQKLINAEKTSEIVWVKNATEGINLISKSLKLDKDDEVLTTDKEHSSNMAPWILLKKKGVEHKIVNSNEDLSFDIEEFERMMSDSVKLVSMAWTSILDGYTIPVEEIIKIAHDNGALVLLDGVLTVPHQPVNVAKLDVDFLVFSLGNMCGPKGVGVLYGKEHLLEELNEFNVGGGNVVELTFENSEFYGPPGKFEAGSVNFPAVIGAGAAVDYITSIGMENIQRHGPELNKKLNEALLDLEPIDILGPSEPELRGGMCSFNISGINPHDVAIHLEESAKVLVRSGILCSHGWFKAQESNGAVNVLNYIYNTHEEIEYLCSELKKLIRDLQE